jgi:hypothetical protein
MAISLVACLADVRQVPLAGIFVAGLIQAIEKAGFAASIPKKGLAPVDARAPIN